MKKGDYYDLRMLQEENDGRLCTGERALVDAKIRRTCTGATGVFSKSE
jgi:hypothetical protein